MCATLEWSRICAQKVVKDLGQFHCECQLAVPNPNANSTGGNRPQIALMKLGQIEPQLSGSAKRCRWKWRHRQSINTLCQWLSNRLQRRAPWELKEEAHRQHPFVCPLLRGSSTLQAIKWQKCMGTTKKVFSRTLKKKRIANTFLYLLYWWVALPCKNPIMKLYRYYKTETLCGLFISYILIGYSTLQATWWWNYVGTTMKVPKKKCWQSPLLYLVYW